VNFIGWFETDMHVCIAMDYHELGSLDQYLIPMHAPIPESEVKFIMEQVLKALGFMHGLHFMHRDLKPAVCSSLSKRQNMHQLT
jgi:serine/threonine protein kinase